MKKIDIGTRISHKDSPFRMPITIVSSDNVPFIVSSDVAKMSGLIESIFEESETDQSFPMLGVDSSELKKIIEFCEHCLVETMPEIPKPLQSNDFSTLVPAWFHNFANIDHTELFKIVEAANYMDIKPLVNLICAKIASMIKDKSIAEIRRTFSIEAVLTPEEEETMRQDLQWCEE